MLCARPQRRLEATQGRQVAGPGYHVEVHGSVAGNLVVGDHNLIVNAATGSSVRVIQEAERPRPVRRPRIRVLPRRPAATFGRDSERGAIAAAVVSGSSMQVYGESGMGKSTLLRQAAYDLADEADVVFVAVSGRGHLDVPQQIFEACYDASGYRPGPTELARMMAGVRACVLADDLECTPDEVQAILDAAPDAAFVFSAAERELWGQGQALELSGLPVEAALALVRRELGRELTPAESQAALAQWRLAGGSPMRLLRAVAALSRFGPAMRAGADADAEGAAGRRAAGEVPAAGPARGVASVPQPGARAGEPAGAGGAPGDVERPVEAAALVAGLSPAQRDVVGLLRAVGRARVTAPVIASLAGAPDVAHAASAAERLVAAGLADETDDGFRLAADVAAGAAEERYRRGSAELVAAMLAWLEEPGRTVLEAARQADVVVSLVDAATRDGHADLGTRLARVAAPLMALSLRWGAWRDVLTSGLAAAQAAGDRESVAYFTHERGIRMLCLGQAAAAAAVLATAAGLWSALGMHHSAALAAQAQSIATSGHAAAGVAGQAGAAHAGAGQQAVAHGAGSAGGHGGGAGGGGAGGGGAGGAAGAGPGPGPRRGGRAVGKASVSAPRRVPVALIATVAVVVVLAIAGAFTVPRLLGNGRSQAHRTTTPTFPPSTPASTPATPPTPVAFSDFTAPRRDPATVLDGNPDTFWAGQPTLDPKAFQWIAVDMGQVGPWTGMVITPVEGFRGFPRAFRIESSTDGSDWTPVPGQDYNDQNPVPQVSPVKLAFDPPVNARYLRIFAYELALADSPTSVEVQHSFIFAINEIEIVGG
jgi:hypothetical protein